MFFKLYWDKEKSKFISLKDYFALLLVLYICDFYNYQPVFEMKLIFRLIVSDEQEKCRSFTGLCGNFVRIAPG